MKSAELEPYLKQVFDDAVIEELPNHYRGKVRDNYDLADGRRIIIATDRISAFDRILTSIPLKGQVLTQIARFWFEATKDVAPNHVLSYPDPNVLVGRRLDILPVEIVVRDYLAGTTSTSILTMYRAGKREMYGFTFPDGMEPNQKLPETIITPTSKEFDGGHDAPLTADEILARGIITAAQWTEVSELAMQLFARGRSIAREHGLILADTKYEFGVDKDGAIILADEIHTPDSSRYWFAESYEARLAAGQPPESFDKDFVRSWVAARCDPYNDPIPAIPPEIILEAAQLYLSVFERITGRKFPMPDPNERVIERVRRNLSSFM